MAVLGDLATNVAAGLITEGLRYPLHALSSEMRRRDQVGRALNERASTKQVKSTARIDEALRDLTRIIGNSEGKLDLSTAAFLRELQRTTIPATLAQLALCGRDPTPVFPAFESLYRLFPNLSFQALPLFNGLFQAIVARIDGVEDPALLDIVRAQNHELSKQLDQIVAALAALDSKPTVTLAHFQDARMGSRAIGW